MKIRVNSSIFIQWHRIASTAHLKTMPARSVTNASNLLSRPNLSAAPFMANSMFLSLHSALIATLWAAITKVSFFVFEDASWSSFITQLEKNSRILSSSPNAVCSSRRLRLDLPHATQPLPCHGSLCLHLFAWKIEFLLLRSYGLRYEHLADGWVRSFTNEEIRYLKNCLKFGLFSYFLLPIFREYYRICSNNKGTCLSIFRGPIFEKLDIFKSS